MARSIQRFYAVLGFSLVAALSGSTDGLAAPSASPIDDGCYVISPEGRESAWLCVRRSPEDQVRLVLTELGGSKPACLGEAKSYYFVSSAGVPTTVFTAERSVTTVTGTRESGSLSIKSGSSQVSRPELISGGYRPISLASKFDEIMEACDDR